MDKPTPTLKRGNLLIGPNSFFLLALCQSKRIESSDLADSIDYYANQYPYSGLNGLPNGFGMNFAFVSSNSTTLMNSAMQRKKTGFVVL